MRTLFFILVALCYLTGCSNDTNYAPVMDIATIEHVPKAGVYRVSPGETLYSIAWRYGLDYRYIASINHIQPPYHVAAGQLLALRKSTRIRRSMPAVYPSVKKAENYFVEPERYTPVTVWRWPAMGPVIGVYSALNKGINIGGQFNDPVYATADGQVVYSGNRLRGYGKLIIIKHNSAFLTAYAHNNHVLVREGQWVKAGQRIADMGNTDARRVMLHFEIRHDGQPVNPLRYLPNR
jgi:lipoprotein NlpD